MSLRGALRFGRYAFGPNRFGYCGPPDYKALLEYVSLGEADQGLIELSRRFDGAYPYLQLIAHANGTDDAFDERVVEAYWLGNDWLRSVGPAEMRNHIDERFKPRLAQGDLASLGASLDLEHPHHNFHVFQIYRRAGLHGSPGADVALGAMDSCRISWGTVRSVEAADLVVERHPLSLEGGRLVLGQPELVRVSHELDGLGFVSGVKQGDVVSLHWDWACEVLTPGAVARLEKITAHCMELANRTI